MRLWAEPDGGWYGPVVVAGLVAAELSRAAAVAGTPAPAIDALAANDLQADAVLDALADLRQARGRGRTAGDGAADAIGAMSAREIDAVATVKAAAGTRATQKAFVPTPAVAATVSLAHRADLKDPAAWPPRR